MNAVRAMTLAETKLFLRDYATWGAAVILPTVILVILGLIFGNAPERVLRRTGVPRRLHAVARGAHRRDAQREHDDDPPCNVSREGHPSPAVDGPGSAGRAARRRAGGQPRRGDRRGRPAGDRGERRIRRAVAAEPRSVSSPRSGSGRRALFALALLFAAVVPSASAATALGLVRVLRRDVPRRGLPAAVPAARRRPPDRRVHAARRRRASRTRGWVRRWTSRRW